MRTPGWCAAWRILPQTSGSPTKCLPEFCSEKDVRTSEKARGVAQEGERRGTQVDGSFAGFAVWQQQVLPSFVDLRPLRRTYFVEASTCQEQQGYRGAQAGRKPARAR